MKEKTIILDLDDTLYCEHDYVKSGFAVVANFLAAEAKQQDHLVIYKKMIEIWMEHGRGKVFDLVCSFFSIEQVDIHQLVQLYRTHLPSITLYDDAVAFLNNQIERGVPLGLVTNGLSVMQWNKVKALKLTSYIDAIVVADDLGGQAFWKPSPTPYLKALEILQITAQEAIYVGDNPNLDFITAKKLGLETVRIIRDHGDHMNSNVPPLYQADRQIYSLLELIDG
ncbi:putative hydrolase of the HAD superfamily [Natronobacillus azotifigens]|uniref:HAD family hydrolase n=1 Tax=Natronobacillus azotifigens TaxID=472978 RepID=A0A9J6R977_9BACI|nr:HAD family hydrolase [Natronobacillus azotifigens]MCZ0702103.1 HAD family hydrolase [Natronobacillus azotifigens]